MEDEKKTNEEKETSASGWCPICKQIHILTPCPAKENQQ